MNMQILKSRLIALTAAGGFTLIGGTSQAALISLHDVPLFLTTAAAPLNMLVMGRDHKLYMAAYNDASDLNGDNKIDIGYKGYLPVASGGMEYMGYFDSERCYTHDGAKFVPQGAATLPAKTCSGQWSGDFLNYLTTSRIDALRKVLYGGYRSTDSTSETILERAYIPQDAHSYGKEYQSVARDGYDISLYTPYSAPATAGNYILFANTTPTTNIITPVNPSGAPLLRVIQNTPHRVWDWLSKNAPVAGSSGNNCGIAGGGSEEPCGGTLTDLIVRVSVCVTGKVESNCKQYPNGGYKPTGLLHQYGETNAMYFGLMTGSYEHNKSGGVLRKEVTSFTDEVIANTGQFSDASTAKKGLIASLDGLKMQDFTGTNGTYSHNRSCSNPWDNPQAADNCRSWGNPIGEILFESLRYFSGSTAGTTGYTYGTGTTDDSQLGLTQVTTWRDPYAPAGATGLGHAFCAKPFSTIISDVNPSFDSELPGNPWNTGLTFSLQPPISSLNVSTEGQTIWNGEFTGSKDVFIGDNFTTTDGAPTPKPVSSFGNIRGLSPEEPTKQGTYYSASVAYFGHRNDISSTSGTQSLNTFSIGLSSPIPRIELPVNGRIVTLVPMGKVVAGPSSVTVTDSNPNRKSLGAWQPTSQIAAFYISQMENMPGQTVNAAVNGGLPKMQFRINFEDSEQGNDYDADAIVLYDLTVKSDGTVDVQLTTTYASAGHESHLGYVIAGVEDAGGTDVGGIYMEVAGGGSAGGANSVHYKFDTPAGKWAGQCLAGTCAQLPGPGVAGPVRNFKPRAGTQAILLEDPLWYAAKWGGFDDFNKDGLPNPSTEWDADNNGTPDNYFLVTNPLQLGPQMARAFNGILSKTSSASSASVNSGSISSQSRVYQATFSSADWTGHLLSFPVISVTNTATGDVAGRLRATAEWDAAGSLPAHGSRRIYTRTSAATPTTVEFNFASLSSDATRLTQLDPNTGSPDAADIINYLRGDATKEGATQFRARQSKLGDIINSTPLFVGPPNARYPDNLEGATNPYSTFAANNRKRRSVIFVGANDGMLHAFDVTVGDAAATPAVTAGNGKELFAYIPGGVFSNLKRLTQWGYSHKYFVDGSPSSADAFFQTPSESVPSWRTVVVGGLNNGGRSIYALDVTTLVDSSGAPNFDASKVLWEFTDPDLGFTHSQPVIARTGSTAKDWVAIFGNGYNNSQPRTDGYGAASTTGHAYLYIVRLSDGVLLKKIDVQAGLPNDTATPNGLSSPVVIDSNGDSKADYVYAGDLQGNMWKFDIRNTNPASWGVAYTRNLTIGATTYTGVPGPLYIAKDSYNNVQPITTRPEVIRGPSGAGMVVLFGTGKYLENSDKLISTSLTPPTNSLYGIYDANYDSNDPFTGRSNLRKEAIVQESASGTGRKVRVTDTVTPIPATVKGWYMDLVSPAPTNYVAERVITRPVLRDGRVVFTTMNPKTNSCDFGGGGWVMELEPTTGKRLGFSPIDVNRDELLNSGDLVTYGSSQVPASGFESEEGIIFAPGVIDDPNSSAEFKYQAGTSGNIQTTTESKEGRKTGRQSWKPER